MDEKTFFRRSWTWGVIMTVIGKMVHTVLGWFGYKAERNMYGYVIYIGKGWGGAGMGPYCIACRDISISTLNHEFGHAIQNCYFGPFQLVISLMSAARYLYREYLVRAKGKKYLELPDYDSAWYEGMATEIGNQYALELR